MFSLNEIINRKSMPISHTEKSEFNQRRLIQSERENNYLSDRKCLLDMNDVLRQLSNIDTDKLTKEVENNFYNPNLIDANICISEALALVNKDHINSYLTNLKKLAAGIQGTTFTTDFINKHNSIFVIKERQDNYKYSDPNIPDDIGSKHEAFVGMKMCELRKLIPNFSCVYAYFKCMGDIKSDLLCLGNSVNSHIIYEKISPTLNFKDIYPEDFMKYFIQLLYALKVANEKLNFTHYDLHHENVLFKYLPEEIIIHYPTSKGVVSIKTNVIATIIDYGYAFIQIGDEKFGIDKNMQNVSTFNDRSFIIYDVFKFLCFSLYENKKLYPILPLLSYFIGNDDPISFLDNCREYYFSVPYNDVTKNFDMDDFIQYCLQTMENMGYSSPIIDGDFYEKSLSCYFEKCESFPEVLKSINLEIGNPLPYSNDVSIVLDILSTLEKESTEYTQYLFNIIENYPNSYYNKIIDTSIDKINNIITQIDNEPNLDRQRELLNLIKIISRELRSLEIYFELPDNDRLIINKDIIDYYLNI